MNFEVDGAGGAGLNALCVTMDDASEASGPPGNREVWFRVVEDLRFESTLPAGDLLLESKTQRYGIKRAAIEKDGAHPWAAT